MAFSSSVPLPHLFSRAAFEEADFFEPPLTAPLLDNLGEAEAKDEADEESRDELELADDDADEERSFDLFTEYEVGDEEEFVEIEVDSDESMLGLAVDEFEVFEGDSEWLVLFEQERADVERPCGDTEYNDRDEDDEDDEVNI